MGESVRCLACNGPIKYNELRRRWSHDFFDPTAQNTKGRTLKQIRNCGALLGYEQPGLPPHLRAEKLTPETK